MLVPILTLLIHLTCVLGWTIPQHPFQAFSTSQSTILSSELIDKIEHLRTKWEVKGISIGLAASSNTSDHSATRDNWALEAITFGEADRYGKKVKGDTLFAIASNSKLFHALSVGLLMNNDTLLPDGDKLRWSTKIKDVLPEWKLMDDYASDHVDLVDLASMRSGLPRHDIWYGVVPPVEVVSNMRNLRPSTELRQHWQYNNNHYVTIGLIIERLSGLTLPEYVKLHIFDPVGLTSATYNATQARESGHRSDGFSRQAVNYTACKASIEQGSESVDRGCLGEAGSIDWWIDGDGLWQAAPGGVIMSANDMAKWVKELLQPSVLPPSLIQAVTTGYSVMDGLPTYPQEGIKVYGLGQWMYEYRGHRVHGHTGSVPGQMSRMVRLPDLGMGFMIAINDDIFGLFLHEAIANLILDDILQVNDPIDWETYVANQSVASLPSYTDVPLNPQLFNTTIEGNYYDAGYGNLNIVQVQSLEPSLADIIVRTPLNVTGPIYLAQLNSLWISHMVFTHFDGQLFNWTLVYTADKWDEHDQKAGKLGKTEGTGTAIFTEDGLGMFGDYWGKGSTVPGSVVDEGKVKENAEVWYRRL
ncbi:hypothetical protein L486_06081 [Kwoniella mangroviensis CBS 10435]|uniref:Beta-lactamase-related domain-containing protein n=1 Tax=Kwoniella mangroviensis CBS 10435 TaxID=1331196 RepID=A0A1B9IL84_9TREE|nr:hypothetical protein L486_06081 [Kwoniella mangroviensis CBS 10435]